MRWPVKVCLLACSAGFLAGCQSEAPPTPQAGSSAAAAPAEAAPAAASPAGAATPEAVSAAPPALPRISLGGGGTGTADTSGSGSGASSATVTFTRDDVLAALKPMQILRDEWSGIRQKSVGSQDAGEDFSWIWDHRTNPRQPALVMNSPDGKYFRHLRLTFDPSQSQFQLTMTTPDDVERTFAGDYSEPVQEVQTADNKVHRVYKLQLTELTPRDDKDQWRLVFNQQENNRYLLELNRRRGEAYQRFETISAQRKGTSFALSDTDYGDRTCVISGGLGTSQVSYMGRSFWVCCSGCQAAFQEDPVRWIADFDAKKTAGTP